MFELKKKKRKKKKIPQDSLLKVMSTKNQHVVKHYIKDSRTIKSSKYKYQNHVTQMFVVYFNLAL